MSIVTAETEIMPTLLGYICEHVLMDSVDLAVMTRRLELFAREEGYTVGAVYVERLDRSPAACRAMVEELRRHEARGVAIPGVTHLLALGGLVRATQHLQRCVGARVLIAGES